MKKNKCDITEKDFKAENSKEGMYKIQSSVKYIDMYEFIDSRDDPFVTVYFYDYEGKPFDANISTG